MTWSEHLDQVYGLVIKEILDGVCSLAATLQSLPGTGIETWWSRLDPGVLYTMRRAGSLSVYADGRL